MKINKYIYSLVSAALLLGGVTACSPDDWDLSKPDLSPEDLTEGNAYTVDVAADNTITLTSLLDKSYNVFWNQPNGRSNGTPYQFQLPFAGEYEVAMGVDTRGGLVFGEPYKFSVTTNNMSLLQDPLYTYLSGGVGKSKKWVPVDKAYGVGQCTGPVMYCNPGDVLNDGTNSTDIGLGKMVPNWDPGFQSWLIPSDSPYMNSYMTFSLDDKNGCTIEEFQGEKNETLTGKWNLNLSDKNHPRLSFVDTYLMHNTGFDAVCENYTTDLYITELSPYMLQLATMRTNSEGAWWIVWNFIAEDVKTGKVVIPSDAPGYIDPSAPALPKIADLTTKLFQTDINGVTFIGSQMTYLVNDESAYDWMWWNGANGAWEPAVNGKYNDSYFPKPDADAMSEVELTFAKKNDGTYTYECGSQSGTMTITGDNTITFDKPVTLFTVDGAKRKVALTGKTWTVFKCDPGSELIIGVPDQKDAKGDVNTYRVANLVYKEVGGGNKGPVAVKFNQANVKYNIEADKYFRCQLYNPWGGGGDAVEASALKLKKNQKINVTLKLSGFTFSQPAKMVLCVNRGNEQEWEPKCFDYSRAVTVNGDGTYTVSWTNDTGSTANWTDATSALTITMQFDGYATLPDTDYASHCSVESITIE